MRRRALRGLLEAALGSGCHRKRWSNKKSAWRAAFFRPCPRFGLGPEPHRYGLAEGLHGYAEVLSGLNDGIDERRPSIRFERAGEHQNDLAIASTETHRPTYDIRHVTSQ
jgi:hypothetical protein